MSWMHRRFRALRLTLLGLGLGLVTTGCANDITDFAIEQPLGWISELAIGLQYPMDRDPLVRGWVNQLGQETRANVRRKRVPYRFSLVDLAAPNAFAIPYGGIYATKGVINFADSEDELAFIIGHEIGHVERRHSSFAFQRNMLISLGLSLLTNDSNRDFMQIAQIASYFMDLKFSRDAESGADHSGAELAVATGYNPHRSIDFFRRLDRVYGATPRFFSYFQTHPINEDRITRLRTRSYLSLTDPVMMTTIGNGYSRRLQFANAEKFYQGAVVADPNYGDGYLGLARVAAYRGDTPAARNHYQQALAHGASQQTVQAEVTALTEPAAQPSAGIVVASARDADAARTAIASGDGNIRLAMTAAQALAAAPVDASPALVASHNEVGTVIDRLNAMGGSLSTPGQTVLRSGIQVRAAAMAAASEAGESGQIAEETVELYADNQRRLARLLANNPSAEAVALAARVQADQETYLPRLRNASERLQSDSRDIAAAVRESHRIITALRQVPNNGALGSAIASRLQSQLEAANTNLKAAQARAESAVREVRSGQAAGLVNSIDISMVDRRRPERSMAQHQVHRFMLAEPAIVERLLASGLSLGETAYTAGYAKSGDVAADTLAADARGARNSIVAQLDRGGSRSANVALMLRLLDLTLREELEAESAKPLPQPLPTQPDEDERDSNVLA